MTVVVVVVVVVMVRSVVGEAVVVVGTVLVNCAHSWLPYDGAGN